MASRPTVAPTLIMAERTAFAVVGDVSVLVFTQPRWTLEDVDRLYDETAALVPHTRHSLIRYLAPPPGARVRGRLVERQRELERSDPSPTVRRVAALTTSAVIRGAVTAWNWLTKRDVRAYAPDDALEASRWLIHGDRVGAGSYEIEVETAYTRCMALVRAHERRRPSSRPGARAGDLGR